MKYARFMDLLAGCRCFVEVSDRGSFTGAAVALNIVQPVVSRRVAALERHLGGALFYRSTRNVVLTQLGVTMLAKARRLCAMADELALQAAEQRAQPIRLCVPEQCDLPELASVVAVAHRLRYDVRICRCDVRSAARAFRELDVDILVESAPEPEAQWSAELGVASQLEIGAGRFFLDSLRTASNPAANRAATLWLQEIDDVPAIRDALFRAGDRSALARGQLRVAAHLTEWISPVSFHGALLLCTVDEAERYGLFWRRLGDLSLHRYLRMTAREATPKLTGSIDFGRAMAKALGLAAAPTQQTAGRAQL